MAPARISRTQAASKVMEPQRTKPRTSKPNEPERNELVIISIPSDNDDSSDDDGSLQSDSDDDGSPPLTTPLDNTREVTETDSNGAADAGGRLRAAQPEVVDRGHSDDVHDTGVNGHAGGGQEAEGGKNVGASEIGHIGSNDRPQARNDGHSVPTRRGTTQHDLRNWRLDEMPYSEEESDNASADVTRPNKVSTLQSVRLAARTATTAPANGNRKAKGGDATTQSERRTTIYPLNQDTRRDSQALEAAVGRPSTEAKQRTDSRKRRVDVAFYGSPSNRTEQESDSPCSTTGANGPYKRYRIDTEETSNATKEVEVPTPTNERSTAATKSSRFLLSNANIRMMTPEGDGSMTVEIDGHWSISFIDMPVPCRKNGDPSTIWVLSVRQLHGDVNYLCEGFLGIHARAPQTVVEIP